MVIRRLLAVMAAIALPGCHGYPADVVPVDEFEVGKYLGKWYEIARLDHSFERGLEQVTADYSLETDGRIRVVNRGFSPESGAWKEAVGVAKFAGKHEEGYLQVSFFGPFYSSYVIFGLDRDTYQYAFISGPSHSYLWLLSRTPQVDSEVLGHFLEAAGNAGFAVEELIYVRHELEPGSPQPSTTGTP